MGRRKRSREAKEEGTSEDYQPPAAGLRPISALLGSSSSGSKRARQATGTEEDISEDEGPTSMAGSQLPQSAATSEPDPRPSSSPSKTPCAGPSTGLAQSSSIAFNLELAQPPSSVLNAPLITPGLDDMPWHLPRQPVGLTPEDILAARDQEAEAARKRQDIELKRQAAQQKREASMAKRQEEARIRLEAKTKQHQSSLEAYGHTRTKKDAEVMDTLFQSTQRVLRVKSWSPSPACSPEQLAALRAVQDGRNVLGTGPAGTGKSFLLSQIKDLLDFVNVKWVVTAPTGIAALNIGGKTIHSWMKLGLADKSCAELLASARERMTTQWTETQVLIIDEISMVHPVLFQKIDVLAREIRNIAAPFGGMQLIVTGDFYQLPPVIKEHECPACGAIAKLTRQDDGTYAHRGRGGKWDEKTSCGQTWPITDYVFETPTWSSLQLFPVELSRVFRQDEKVLVDCLARIRTGDVDDSVLSVLRSCERPLDPEAKIKPTKLYPLRANVASDNANEFAKLKTEIVTYRSVDLSKGDVHEETMRKRLEDVPAAKELRLREGAQVMLTFNLSVAEKLANGSRGVIIDFQDAEEYLNSLSEQTDSATATAHERAQLEAAKNWALHQGGGERARLPVVLFASGATKTIAPNAWIIDVDYDKSISRTQLPLMLAWAISIHKSQGATLDSVMVLLSGVFAPGQAYVALSRCRTLEGMQIDGLGSGKGIKVDPKVAEFYKDLHEPSEPQPYDRYRFFPNMPLHPKSNPRDLLLRPPQRKAMPAWARPQKHLYDKCRIPESATIVEMDVDVKAEPAVKDEPQVKAEPQAKDEPAVKAEPDSPAVATPSVNDASNQDTPIEIDDESDDELPAPPRLEAPEGPDWLVLMRRAIRDYQLSTQGSIGAFMQSISTEYQAVEAAIKAERVVVDLASEG